MVQDVAAPKCVYRQPLGYLPPLSTLEMGGTYFFNILCSPMLMAMHNTGVPKYNASMQ